MRPLPVSTVALGLLVVVGTTGFTQQPPRATRSNHVDVYHDTSIADPYRWLEAMDAPETVRWVRAQDAHARAFAATPVRSALHERIRTMGTMTRYGVPTRAGSGLFYIETEASFSERVVMYHPDGAAPRVLLTSRPLVDDPDAQLTRFTPSRDGRYVAYGVATGWTRWERWRIRDVATGRDLNEELRGINRPRSGINWAPDGSGFYYDRFAEPEAGAQLTSQLGRERVYFHRLGTAQSADHLVHDPGHDDRWVAVQVTTDGRYLIIRTAENGANENTVAYRAIGADTPFAPLIAEPDANYSVVGNAGPVFWLYTTADAPRGRVIAIDGRRPARSNWREIIPEAEETIDSWIGAQSAGERILVGYRRDALLVMKMFERSGRFVHEVPLPKVGSVWSFTAQQGDPVAFYSLSDFADPGTVYRLDVRTGQSTPVLEPKMRYDPDMFVTRQVFYTSKDGTRVPMFVAHRRDLELDGQRPTMMYGYGAFNWAASPWFQPHVAALMEMGGVYALPNIRGGGEYGDEWYRAGIKRNRQTAIDDYIAATEWLMANGYTSPRRMVANGSSAGGPLVGAVLNQRPDLFGAAIIDFPALDMLRLEAFPGGRGWTPDVGTIANRDDFEALLAYSPYHNIAPGACYPPTLVTPGEKDETTVPAHAYKYVAALQHAQACDNPILLRVSWGAGHSYGTTTQDSMENWADQLAFLTRVLRLEEAGAASGGS